MSTSGSLQTSWFLEVAVQNTDHTVGLYSAVVRGYPTLFANVRRFSNVIPALQADFALARRLIHPIATDAEFWAGKTPVLHILTDVEDPAGCVDGSGYVAYICLFLEQSTACMRFSI